MQEWGWFDMSCIGSPQVLVIGPQILIFCPVPSQGTQISCLIFRPSQTRMVAKFYKQYKNESVSDDEGSNENYDKQEASEMQDMNMNKKFQVRESYNPEEISLQNQDNIPTFEENSETQEEEREIKMNTDQVNFELPVETSEDNTQLEPSHNEVSQRRSTRTRKPPNRLGEWVFCAQDKNILKDPTNAKEALSSENNEEWHKAK